MPQKSVFSERKWISRDLMRTSFCWELCFSPWCPWCLPLPRLNWAFGSSFPRILPGICAGCFRLFASRTRNSGSDFQAPSCSTLCSLPWCEGACAARLPGTGALSPSPGPGLWEDSHGLPYQQGLTGATTNQMSLGMVVVQWLFIWGLWIQRGCSLGGASRTARRC